MTGGPIIDVDPQRGERAGMGRRVLGATVRRILQQLRHDPRTIGMIIGIPIMLIALLYFMFDGRPGEFDAVALTMLAIFPFTIMFLITSISMLRRTRAIVLRLRQNRVPGGATATGGGHPADPALRPVRTESGDGRLAHGHLRCSAAVLCRPGGRRGRRASRTDRPHLAGSWHHGRMCGAGPAVGLRHIAAADRLIPLLHRIPRIGIRAGVGNEG